MTSPRDEVDEWLDGEVTPLYPKTGSLERIRGQARKRKRRQALTTAAGCAVVIAAAVSVPQLVASGQQAGAPARRPLAVVPTLPAIHPTGSASQRTNRSTVDGRATQVHQHTYLTTGNSHTIPPAHFRPTSVTVVGAGTSSNPKFVGAVIGQAGPP